jgi:hypothetical protein
MPKLAEFLDLANQRLWIVPVTPATVRHCLPKGPAVLYQSETPQLIMVLP